MTYRKALRKAIQNEEITKDQAITLICIYDLLGEEEIYDGMVTTCEDNWCDDAHEIVLSIMEEGE